MNKIFLFFLILSTFNVFAEEEAEIRTEWINPHYPTLASVTSYTKAKLDLLHNGNNTILIRHSVKPHVRSNGLIRLSVIKPEILSRPSIVKTACLSEMGREEAFQLGQIFRDFKISAHSVYSSDMCRAFETAELAFQQKPILYNFLNYMVPNATEALNNEKYRTFFFDHESVKGNRVIVGHGQAPRILNFGDAFKEGWDESGVFIYNHDQKRLIFSANTLEQMSFWYYSACRFGYTDIIQCEN